MSDEPSKRRRVRSAQTPLPEKILAKFGGPQAQPRLVQAYDPRHGWNVEQSKEFVTLELLMELRAAGVTHVEAKWRSHRARLNLSSILAVRD
jgi:hypothetical protein